MLISFSATVSGGMSKRKLSLQQQRRISEKRLRKATNPDSQILSDKNLGDERLGIVYARYGQQADIIDPEHPDLAPERCHLRANIGSLVVGDRVIWHRGDPSDATSSVIVALVPRTSVLERPDHNQQAKPIAANINLVCVVIAPEPEPHGKLIDRFLVAAALHELEAIIVINKEDLLATDSEDINSLTKLYLSLN